MSNLTSRPPLVNVSSLGDMLSYATLERTVAAALAEDIGTGDITTTSTVGPGAQVSGVIFTRQAGVIAGLAAAELAFKLVDPAIQWQPECHDGATLQIGQSIAYLRGPARGILTAERVALNFLGHLSGVASATARCVAAVAGTPGARARIVDTRKTMPSLRELEKYAVRMGGGSNHRFGLFDGILIKDNHIKAAGGIAVAVELARRHAPHLLKIEVEVETMDEVRQALAAGADVILLDNMSPAEMSKAVTLIAGRALTEASGSLSLEQIPAVAATGVDLISLGRLTHSAPSLDLSLELDIRKEVN